MRKRNRRAAGAYNRRLSSQAARFPPVSDYLPPLVAFLTTFVALAALLRSGAAYRLAVDRPNQRSLHSRPTPRIGGLVLVPAVLLAWALVPGVPAALVALVAALAAVSYVDDRIGVSTLARLAVHLVAAAVFVGLLPWLGSLLAAVAVVLAIAWFANLYNFMDGSDGLAGGMSVIGFSAMGIGGFLAQQATIGLLCASMAAAAAAFLMFNFFPARVFLGDAGSVTMGFSAGSIGILGWQDGAWPLWFPFLAFSPFVVDATATLARRILRGERFWEAHRDHYFQRLIRMGWSHRRTALTWYAAMAAAALLALAMLRLEPAMQLGAGILCLAAFGAAMIGVDRRWKSFAAAGGVA